MCLAIPGKILEIKSDTEPVMGVVSFGGIKKQICLDWVPEAKTGDYILAHVGFAISIIDEEEALATLDLLRQVDGALDDELNAGEKETPAGTP